MSDNSTFDNEQLMDNEESAKGLGLAWTIIIAIVVVGAVAFAISIFFREETPALRTTAISEESASANNGEGGAIQTEGLSAEALFEQGNTFVQVGQFPEAIAAYQKALELNPEYLAVYANLGVVYYQTEQLDLAAQQYEKALEINPDDGEVTYNLAALNLQRALSSGAQPDQDLLDQAITLLEKALALSPDLAEPHFTLGVAYMASQNKDEAIKAFESFLAKDSGTDPRASQEAQSYLDTLRNQ